MSSTKVADSFSVRVSTMNGEALPKRGTISNFAAAATETMGDVESPPTSVEDPVVVAYVLYACVAGCADAMGDAWEDTGGCAQADCLHENILKC